MLTLHIGLPKTGTTYLQKIILPKAPEVMLIHRMQGTEAGAVCMDLRRYVRTNALAAAVLRRRIRAALAPLAARAQAEQRVMLVSAENISVHPIDFWRQTNPSPEAVARRLAALADGPGAGLAPVRVLIGLRRQDQWLASRYAESGKDMPQLSQRDFDRRLAEIAAARELPGALAWLDHHHIYSAFSAALGAQNVHLYRLERIAAKPALTLEHIGRFVGGEALGRSLRRLGGKKRGQPRNVLSLGENTWRLRGDKSELRLDPELAAAVQARFQASNRALQALMRQGAA